MKKLLPILFCLLFIFNTFLTPTVTFAASSTQQLQNNSQPGSLWVIDPEVTFIGKNARRAGDLLNWTLQNYNWVCVKQVTTGTTIQCDNNNNPIAKYWSLIVLYIVIPMLFLVILATSIVIIITRGKSLTITRFIPRFIAVVLLIIFSYSLLQFLYQLTDLIQGFFLRSNISSPCPPNCISDKDLLYVGWSYNNFVGLRLLGDRYAESAFISLLLTKLTALTYFVMVFLLLVRKIILWFFIIISPIFPILLLYYPVRNTAKIWIGEFFRWLLYAPLFAIFLNGLVYLWRNQIPLAFSNPNIGKASAIEYPTAVNILLGGPGQRVTPTNSVNLVETFALYVVSLIMLWIVILLPWILLQIFLDYAQNFAPGDTAFMKTLISMGGPRGGGPSQKPVGGNAITLPFAKKFSVPIDLKPGPTGAAKEINTQGMTISTSFTQPFNLPNATVNAQVLRAANIKLPTIRDIAKFDVTLSSNDISKRQDVNRFSQQLVRIANPASATSATERAQASGIHTKLSQQSKSGNIMASSLINAANASTHSIINTPNQKLKDMFQQVANPALAPSVNREKVSQLNQLLQKESTQNNNQLATSILSVNEKTSDTEIQKIKDQLIQTSNSQVSKAVTSAVSQSEKSSTQVAHVIKQVANPDSITGIGNKEKVNKLRSSLVKASKEGNQLATSILAVDEKTSITEIEALQKRIQDAKEKGEPVAAEIAALANVTETSPLPTINRIQTVNKEDYQAVKDMWKQNYQNQEVPQGIVNRSEWIKEDISGIEDTITLLSSQDQNKVQQGMDQVSNLLPFLLLGGFSRNEIIEYLKAKQDAARDVSRQLIVEEDEKIGVKTHHTQTQQVLAVTMEKEQNTTTDQSPDKQTENTSASPNALQSNELATTHVSSAADVKPVDSLDKIEK